MFYLFVLGVFHKLCESGAYFLPILSLPFGNAIWLKDFQGQLAIVIQHKC